MLSMICMCYNLEDLPNSACLIGNMEDKHIALVAADEMNR